MVYGVYSHISFFVSNTWNYESISRNTVTKVSDITRVSK